MTRLVSIRSTTLICFMTIGFAGLASAQQILKREPPLGGGGAGTGLRSGEVVLVDNGKCPKGQILKVTAGVTIGKNATTGLPRQRECVPRP